MFNLESNFFIQDDKPENPVLYKEDVKFPIFLCHFTS